MEKTSFIPGSEWVYFKLYTGTKTADAILKNEIYGYVNEMLKNDIINKWFFIRYNDPDFHIRLRLHLNNTSDFNSVFLRFYETFLPVIDIGLIWKVQCDTYQREMERYGTNTISIVEDFFFIDSELIIQLLNQLNDENPEHHRWKLALVLIDSFLSAFSYDLFQKKEILNTISENFKKEFGFTHHNAKRQLDNKYRTYRTEIETVMFWENKVSDTIDVIKTQRQVFFPIVENIAEIEKSGDLQVNLKELLSSLIHMTMNRWFRTKNRLHEMVIYDFLSRYYTSEMAKINKNMRK